MSASEDEEPQDDRDAIARLQERGAAIRYGKSGRVLIVDGSEGRLNADDLPALGGLPRLRELHLNACQIDDRIGTWLLQLPRLQVVDLKQTQVTDQIFESIVQLSQLKLLDVTRTAVSLEAVRQMRKRMIKTRIVYL